MIREIVKYGAPELVRPSSAVEIFDDGLSALAQDMLETMYQAGGVGLAAPQVALNTRLIVVDVSSGKESGHQLIMANPRVAQKEGSILGEEGCLSIPGFTAQVERPRWIEVEYQHLTGQPGRLEAEEFLARAICHEIDHLDGVLYLDHISTLKRELILRRIRKMMRSGEW